MKLNINLKLIDNYLLIIILIFKIIYFTKSNFLTNLQIIQSNKFNIYYLIFFAFIYLFYTFEYTLSISLELINLFS